MDSPQTESTPRPEPQVEPGVEPVVADQAASPEPDTGPEPGPTAETLPGSEIGETFAGLLQSAVEFVRAILDWVEERTRTIVKERIAKPLAVATVVAAIGATAMATLVALAICLLIGALHSRRAAVLAFTAFGWYYACDAVFYLIDGFLNHKPVVSNILLNLPHVVISSVMLSTVYILAPRQRTA